GQAKNTAPAGCVPCRAASPGAVTASLPTARCGRGCRLDRGGPRIRRRGGLLRRSGPGGRGPGRRRRRRAVGGGGGRRCRGGALGDGVGGGVGGGLVRGAWRQRFRVVASFMVVHRCSDLVDRGSRAGWIVLMERRTPENDVRNRTAARLPSVPRRRWRPVTISYRFTTSRSRVPA